MKKLKMVTIGGGSSYTPELIDGLIKRYDEFPVSELWLVDVPEGKEKLEIVGQLASRMVKKADIPLDIHLTLNRQEALPDADFVTTQFRVGFLDARQKDELIPLKYDVIGQETNGPGGMFKALRTIPVIFDIIEDCKKLCPQAWIISFTNPSGINAEAVFRHTNWRRFIGLCNGPINMQKDIEKVLQVPSSKLEVRFGGINHMVFALDVKVDGKDQRAALIEQLTDHKESLKNIVDIPWGQDFLKGFGYYGIGYLRYYLQKSLMLAHCKEDAAKGQCRAQVVKQVEKELFTMYADPRLDVKPKALEKRGGAYYSDAACELMASIYNDRHDIQVVDTLNQGAIDNLPDDVVVEVSCEITKDGPIPVHVGPLPWQIAGLVWQLKAFEVMTTNVALSGNYDEAIAALAINPLVQNEKTAKRIFDEMLLAHEKYLPQFQERIAQLKK